MQSEIDTSQTGAGLESDGQYVADGSTNYITTATSLKNADKLLDTQVKVNTDAVTSAQSELDVTQTGAGLEESGGYLADGTTSYLTTATSLKNADKLLDTQVKANTDNLAQEVSDRQTEDALRVLKAGDTISGNFIFTNGAKVTGLQTPVDGDDAANKNYVDLAVQGLSLKIPVRVATTVADITTAGSIATLVGTAPATIDGVTLASGDRVLVTGDVEDAAAGIYVFNGAGSAMTRTADADADGELMSGAFVFANEGLQYADTGFVLVTDADITIGTTPFMFFKATGAGQIIAGTGIAKDGNRLDVNLGAGITETPSDEVGIDTKVDGGLWNTIDGVSSSIDTDAQLAIKVDGTSLTLSPNGIKVSDTFTGNVTAIQSELNTTQAGGGLETDGQYLADATTNYLTGATSLKNADKLLDTQLFTNTNAIGVLGSLTTTAKGNVVSAVNELDSDVGDKSTLITIAKTSMVAAINELAGGGGSTQAELDVTQTGAGLESSGQYSADGTTNYLTGATSLKNADKLLDAQLFTNTNAIAANLAELSVTQTGAGLTTAGAYDPNSSAHYISGATSLFNAGTLLDSQLFINTNAIGVLSGLTTTEKSNLVSAVNELVSSDTQIRSDINALNYTTTTTSAALTHTIAHNLAASYVDYTVLVEGADGKYHNDIVAVTETDNNTLTVELTESRNIKIAVKKVASI